MEKEFLSISEFAELTNLTKQAVYKKLNNQKSKLNNYLKVVDNKKYIDKAALEEEEFKKVEQQFNNKETIFEQQFNNSLIALLESQIAEKDKQIESLFNQLAEKDKQIAEVYVLLNQSQKLQAANQTLLIEKESQKKKGLLRLFSKRSAANETVEQ